MAWPQAGSTYNITSVKHPDYNLNLLGGYGVQKGTNVTLWSKSTTDTDQQWRLDSNNKLYPKLSSTVCLDRYIANDSYYNNADLWTHDDDNQQILMFSETSKGFKIMLRNATVNGATLYLTAPSIPTGGNDPSKVPGANGNVYWSTSISDEDRQLWTFNLIGSPDPGPSGRLTLAQLQAKFPHGKYWNHVEMDENNPDGYTNKPCPSHADTSTCNCFYVDPGDRSYQCLGFAEKCGYDFSGSNPRVNGAWTKTENVSALDSVKPGDIVRYYSVLSSIKHAILVTAVDGNTITYGDCNMNDTCQIRWGATITKDYLRNRFIYLNRAPFTLA